MKNILGLLLLFCIEIVNGFNTFDFYDSIVVEAAAEAESKGTQRDSPLGEEVSRLQRQFISVTGIGQYPGFPPGWPFGIQQNPSHLQQIPQRPTTTTTTPPPQNPLGCVTIRGDYGKCTTLRQCYPVLYTYSAEVVENGTMGSDGDFDLRNPELADILRSTVSGPCDSSNYLRNQFIFRADAEYRRNQICCPMESTKPQLPPWASTTTFKPTTTGSTTIRSLPHPPNVHLPAFGHRPPIPQPGKRTTTPQPPVSSSCGIPKIVGGTEASPGKYPWIVALMNGQKQFCGGSLIDSQYVLTASHCIAHMRPSDVSRVRVLLGTNNIRQLSSGTVVKRVARLVRHRFFSHQTLHNDVAVLQLDSPVKFSDYISPICLARGQNRFANNQATVAGWGSVHEHGPQPGLLREVTIDVWPNDKCKLKYGHLAPGGITSDMVCAGSYNRDACRGDSGGPLMSHTGSYYEQIGVVSWGIGCGRYPGVYSRVTDFLGWITKNIQ